MRNLVLIDEIYFFGSFSADTIIIGLENNVTFRENYWVLNKILNPGTFFMMNSTNIINISYEHIKFTNSSQDLKLEIYYSMEKNVINVENITINVDFCWHYWVLLDESYLNISFLKVINFYSISNELFYLDSSKMNGLNMIFSGNFITNIFYFANCSFSLTNLRYINKNPNSYFLQTNNSNILISSSYFIQNKNLLYSSTISSNFSNIFFIGVYLIGFSNEVSISIMKNSNLTVKKSFFIGNRANNNGGCFCLNFSNERSTKNSIIFKKNLVIENKATNYGGVLYSQASNNQLIAIFSRNIMVFNKAVKGGGFYFDNLENITVSANKFSQNLAFSQDSSVPSKGAVFFLENSLQKSDFPLIFSLKFNSFSLNRAEIGGSLFIQGLSLSFFSIKNNTFTNNLGVFYGNDWASEINTIRFTSLEREVFHKSSNSLDSYYSGLINGIKSGYNYTNCLLSITGFDRFNNLAYNTDEDFIQNLIFSQIYPEFYSISYTPVYYEGSICFSGQFIRMELPLDLNFQFLVTSNLPLSNKEKFFFLTLKFSFCDVGDRLNYNMECTSCPKGTYSFESDFSSNSDSCKLCSSSENFYCFGGGNFTEKPGY